MGKIQAALYERFVAFFWIKFDFYELKLNASASVLSTMLPAILT
jgi:hypothetical protein